MCVAACESLLTLIPLFAWLIALIDDNKNAYNGTEKWAFESNIRHDDGGAERKIDRSPGGVAWQTNIPRSFYAVRCIESPEWLIYEANRAREFFKNEQLQANSMRRPI